MTTVTKILLITFTISILLIKCEQEEHEEHLLTESQIWGFGFLAGVGISLVGFIAALLIVFCKKLSSDYCFEVTIKSLFSLAFGALIGDVMIHILPSAYKTQGINSNYVALIFIGAIIIFLLLQRFFHAFGISHSHWHDEKCHDDHQGAIANHDHPNRIQVQDIHSHDHQHHNHSNCNKQHKNDKRGQNIKSSQIKIQSNNCLQQPTSESQKKKPEEQKSCLENLKGKGPVGYMNLIGSLIHNFIDGLALGVAFATGDKQALVPVLIAIIAHQIPRQMGDVAILMTNSFSNTQTILCNGFVNLVSIVGVLIGLAVTNLSEITKIYIMTFVAGNFTFIAADIWRNLFKNQNKCKNIFEFFGAALGIGCMYLVLLAQSSGQQGHDH